MTSGWRKSFGNVRSGRNLAALVVAGTLAYFLWVKPSQELKQEQGASATLAAASDRVGYVEKIKPVSDPQETRLTYADKMKSEDVEK